MEHKNNIKSSNGMKSTATSIIVSAIFIGLAIVFLSSGTSSGRTELVGTNENVFIEGDTQIIEIAARGGYSPQLSLAKADTPTLLRVKTSGVFDCSGALSIPAIGYRNNLPLSGVTDIPIPPQKQGTSLLGTCAMGMYSFSVNFN
ncbi:MAG: hypothetical protein Q7S86_01995 [bacterium]|nr:hypothetical protein [bacterium]